MQNKLPALTSEQAQVLDDVCYLVNQMIYAERRICSLQNLVFYYGDKGWTSPNAVRLTQNEVAFFSNALLETFLTSYRNLLDFFARVSRQSNRHGDSLAADFGFSSSLVKDADNDFDRVSKHLAHLSRLRRIRTQNESWEVSSILMNCRTKIKEFLTHCVRSYSTMPNPIQTGIANIISDLDFLGTKEHFNAYKHVSTPPFWAHKSAPRISIPEPQKPVGES
jgi:hypothetical protein